MKNNTNTITINREWNFVTKEITSSNKGGTQKGEILFEFQLLLSALWKSRDLKERCILTSIYQKQKEKYEKL